MAWANGDLSDVPGTSRWLDSGALTPEAQAMLNTLRTDTTILCDKRRYGLARIESLSQLAPVDEAAARTLEAALQRASDLYRHDLAYGCLDPLKIYPEHVGIDFKEKNASCAPNLLLRRSLEALKRYETIVYKGGWKPVEARFYLLKEGENDPAVAAIKARLKITGDYNGTVDANLTYGPGLAEAVKRFQARHGLKSDGIVGPNTLRWLNEPVERKVERLKLNIERLRWLTNGVKDFLVANIPDYSLTLYRDEAPVLSMRTVVGRRDRPTPMLADTLTYAVLNPYWRAPKTIVEEDILPKLRAKRFDELALKGIVAVRADDANATVDLRSVDWRRYDAESVPFVFLQKPGPLNYLGLVKFMFPNGFDVYLHDTPHDDYFPRRDRAMSSGCIRLERPIELFYALMNPEGDEGWRYKRIVEELLTRRPKEVGLKRPVPVFILYLTAFVDDEGRVNFRPDIYGYDARMRDFLNEDESP